MWGSAQPIRKEGAAQQHALVAEDADQFSTNPHAGEHQHNYFKHVFGGCARSHVPSPKNCPPFLYNGRIDVMNLSSHLRFAILGVLGQSFLLRGSDQLTRVPVQYTRFDVCAPDV